MITDKIENATMYSEIPHEAIIFLEKLANNLKTGKFTLNYGKITLDNDIYVNVEKYTTKYLNDAKFEAHKKYIDIQLLLQGTEDIYYTDKSQLKIEEPYNESNDIEFFCEKVSQYPKVTLDGTNFVMLFPHEAHAPQASINNLPTDVEKVVIKIRI